MSTIEKVFKDKSQGPYPLGLRVKVVARDQIQTYKKNGEQKSVLTFAVSDGSDVIKVVCYDKKKFDSLTDGANVILREIIKKEENGGRYIVVTASSKVLKSFGNITVSEEILDRAQRIINPPPPEEIPISTALTSPLKQRVTVSGKVIQADAPRTVEVRGESVPIKTISLQDKSGTSKITLWRDQAEAEIQPGQHVTITDVVVNFYQNTTSLSTTSRTKVQKCDAPDVKMIITVVGLGITSDDNIELYTEDDETVTIKKQILTAALSPDGEEIDYNNWSAEEPFKLNVQRKGCEIISASVTL